MSHTSAGLNAAVDGLAAAGVYISAHTADPGDTGTAEVAGGGYARQPTTWGAPADGSRAGSEVVASIPAATTITHWGRWSAVTGGVFLGGWALSAQEAFGVAGQWLHTPTLTVTNAG